MKVTAPRLALSLSLLLSAPQMAAASATPTSVAIRWQVGTRSYSKDLTHIPSVSMTWSKGGALALWSDVGYLSESDRPIVIRALTSSGNPRDLFVYPPEEQVSYRTHFVPVTFGVRVFPTPGVGRSRGLFIEAGPTATFARYEDEGRESKLAFLGGFRAGVGFRFAAIDGSRGEFGMGYYLAEAVGRYPDATGRIGTPGEADVGVFGACVSLGLGD